VKPNNKIRIIDITRDSRYEKYLYTCLSPLPFRRYRKRDEYLATAISKGFKKKILVFNREVVGQIEYAPPEASGYPISGDDVIVMNCIWVLRRAKGHNLGKRLLADMLNSEKKFSGFATIALVNHWSQWLRKDHMEMLGFRSIDSFSVTHKTKHEGQRFKIHFMWLPTTKNAKPPTWNKSEFLKGVDFCLAHPLYHPEKTKLKEILQKARAKA